MQRYNIKGVKYGIVSFGEPEKNSSARTGFKSSRFVENGGQAKEVIQEGLVSVNGEVETRRGRKLYPNDVVSFEEDELTVQK